MAKQRQIELPEELKGKKFRIRKLTPRECFRLMGVDDKDIDKIQAAGVSNSAQYKLAGNSIVVDVLFHLFRKMFIDTESESQQLTLFWHHHSDISYRKHNPQYVIEKSREIRGEFPLIFSNLQRIRKYLQVLQKLVIIIKNK